MQSLRAGDLFLDSEGITLEILRKIQDKKMEVDLEYERTRDLYEKQRVIDNYLEEHQEDNRVLHGYYQNNYKKSRMNRHYKFLYNNTYDLKQIRFSIMSAFASTGIITAGLALVHPYLAAFAIPDWLCLIGFSNVYVKNTVNALVLDKDKYNVYINTLNPLGFLK